MTKTQKEHLSICEYIDLDEKDWLQTVAFFSLQSFEDFWAGAQIAFRNEELNGIYLLLPFLLI